jgi:dipeptidyl aminopeptidase/acylaminoacyl peptidase
MKTALADFRERHNLTIGREGRDMVKRMIMALSVSLSLSAATLAKELHTPTTDELIEFQTPSSAEISPDGRFVAYTTRETHWAENSYGMQLWLAEVRTGQIVKLTNSKGVNREPEWSPDGRWLAFISSRDGAPQVYVISPAGGEARPVTSLGNGVSAFRWAPDSARIAFSTPDSETQPLIDRREKYSDFESVRHDYTMTHLWVGDINGGAPRRLTSGKQFTVGSFSWSPDGRRIAFDAQSRPGLTFDPSADIYVYDLTAGGVKRIVDLEGPDTDPEWSPDGKQIVFTTTMGRPNWFYVDRNLATVPADGGTVTSLTSDFDESASAVAWTQTGIYFTAPKKSGVHLFHLDPRTRVIRQISTRENAVYSSLSFTADFKTVSFLETDASHCPEVYVSQLKPFAGKALTDFRAQLKSWNIASREMIAWTSSDGYPIEGALIKPAHFDPSKKYPLLIIVHGGPVALAAHATLEMNSYYPKEIWAAKGALILEPNYRGSPGYGEKIRGLLMRNLGPAPFADIVSGLDYLISTGMVDKDRVGIMGWSFGGFISAFTTTNSDRFKAASVGAGVTDWRTYDSGSDMRWLARGYLGATPVDDPEIYRRNSPINFVGQAKTPTLIDHGDLDPRVPIDNAYQLFQGLTDRGVPVRFYVYKNMAHGPGRPKTLRAVMDHNLDWFNHYIWGEPFVDDSD